MIEKHYRNLKLVVDQKFEILNYWLLKKFGRAERETKWYRHKKSKIFDFSDLQYIMESYTTVLVQTGFPCHYIMDQKMVK